MGRKLAAVFTSLIVFATAQVQALGLGDIILESALNQPLTARIELLEVNGVRAEDINIRIASVSDFERFSIDRPFFLNSIVFHLQTVGDRTFVVLSTTEPVREPYLSFILETRWPSGRLLSEYTLLMDLPVFSDAPVAQTAQAPFRSRANEIQRQSSQNQNLVQSSSGVSSGFGAGSDTNQRVAGLQSQANLQTQLAADQTVTVGSSDTLWDIALQVRPDRDVSVQQTMLAIQRLNENAFIGNNINLIRSGQVLRVPDTQQIRALSQQQAVSEVSRQNLLFADRRSTPLNAEPLTPPPVPSNVASSSARGELSVIGGAADNADDGSQTARIASLENRMAVNSEELDRVLLQNSELNERLSMLEQQIASAHEIIRLRDLELAQLQQTLAAQTLRDEAPVLTLEPPPLPAVITMAQEQSGIAAIVDALIRNTYALVGGLLLIVLLLVALLRRNRSGSDQFPAEDDDEINSSGGLSNDTPVYTSGNGAGDPVVTGAGFNDKQSDSVSPQESVIIEDTQADADLLDEVDALLAYDRISAARTLLQKAIAAEPQRSDLRLKLLEVYVADGDDAGFKDEEASLTAIADSVALSRIEELRSQLPDGLERTSLSGGFFDFNELEAALDLGIEDESATKQVTAAPPVDAGDIGTESPAGDHEEEFSVDLSDLAPLTGGTQALEESEEFVLDQQAVKAAVDEIESIDFSLDDLQDMSTKIASAADTDDGDADADDFDDNDLRFLSDSDEAATKLDLARAYIDMGDDEGAREILQEVLTEGTAVQINEARSLLERIV